MDETNERTLSRKRRIQPIIDEYFKNKRINLATGWRGQIKQDKEIIWEIFLQQPCIHEFPIFIWDQPNRTQDTVYQQVFDYYGLFRVMGQCKVFKKTYDMYSDFNIIWHGLWNRNYILKLYARRKTLTHWKGTNISDFIRRDILFALKLLIIATQRSNFCTKKEAIGLLEL